MLLYVRYYIPDVHRFDKKRRHITWHTFTLSGRNWSSMYNRVEAIHESASFVRVLSIALGAFSHRSSWRQTLSMGIQRIETPSHENGQFEGHAASCFKGTKSVTCD